MFHTAQPLGVDRREETSESSEKRERGLIAMNDKAIPSIVNRLRR